MDPKRWKQVDDLFQSALDHPPAERDAYLCEACAGDDDLEREVRSLLTRDESAQGFLPRTAIQGAAISLAAEDSASDSFIGRTIIGRTIGRYRISGQLGSGGMGGLQGGGSRTGASRGAQVPARGVGPQC